MRISLHTRWSTLYQTLSGALPSKKHVWLGLWTGPDPAAMKGFQSIRVGVVSRPMCHRDPDKAEAWLPRIRPPDPNPQMQSKSFQAVPRDSFFMEGFLGARASAIFSLSMEKSLQILVEGRVWFGDKLSDNFSAPASCSTFLGSIVRDNQYSSRFVLLSGHRIRSRRNSGIIRQPKASIGCTTDRTSDSFRQTRPKSRGKMRRQRGGSKYAPFLEMPVHIGNWSFNVIRDMTIAIWQRVTVRGGAQG